MNNVVQSLSPLIQERKKRNQRQFLFCLGLITVITFSALHLGHFKTDVLELIQALFSPEISADAEVQWYIFFELRAPRIVLAMFVGAFLAMSGCAMQGLVRNPLADPGLIGISGGAAAAAAAAIMFLPAIGFLGVSSQLWTTLFAFAGALISVWLVLLIANSTSGIRITTLILAGVAINALSGTLIGIMSYVADDDALRQISYWSLGSLGGITWSKTLLVLAFSVPLLFLFKKIRAPLNLLSLGENEARMMGLNVPFYKNLILWLVAFAVALATSLCGIIGFVGLVVPHIARLIFGANHHNLMPACGLLGALLLVTADALSRNLVYPLEIPIGIITSAIGAPFFLYLLKQNKEVRNVAS